MGMESRRRRPRWNAELYDNNILQILDTYWMRPVITGLSYMHVENANAVTWTRELYSISLRKLPSCAHQPVVRFVTLYPLPSQTEWSTT